MPPAHALFTREGRQKARQDLTRELTSHFRPKQEDPLTALDNSLKVLTNRSNVTPEDFDLVADDSVHPTYFDGGLGGVTLSQNNQSFNLADRLAQTRLARAVPSGEAGSRYVVFSLTKPNSPTVNVATRVDDATGTLQGASLQRQPLQPFESLTSLNQGLDPHTALRQEVQSYLNQGYRLGP